MALLGRSHQGSPEAEDTLTMISHGVEISIAGGGADEKDGHVVGLGLLYYTVFQKRFSPLPGYLRFGHITSILVVEEISYLMTERRFDSGPYH